MTTILVALGFILSLSFVASILVISAMVVSGRTSPEFEDFEPNPTVVIGTELADRGQRLPGGALARSASSQGDKEPAADALTPSRARATMESA